MFLMGFVLAVWTGLEPATPCVTGRGIYLSFGYF